MAIAPLSNEGLVLSSTGPIPYFGRVSITRAHPGIHLNNFNAVGASSQTLLRLVARHYGFQAQHVAGSDDNSNSERDHDGRHRQDNEGQFFCLACCSYKNMLAAGGRQHSGPEPEPRGMPPTAGTTGHLRPSDYIEPNWITTSVLNGTTLRS
jgi:hypothetical protein